MLLTTLLIEFQGTRTEVQAAADLGVSPSTLSNWKDGLHTPSRLAIPAVARAMGISEDRLRAAVAEAKANRVSMAGA